MAQERSVADVHRTAAKLKSRPSSSLLRVEKAWLAEYDAACVEVERAEKAQRAKKNGLPRAVKAEPGTPVSMRDLIVAARVANEANCILIPDDPQPPTPEAIKRESTGATSAFSAVIRAASRVVEVPE